MQSSTHGHIILLLSVQCHPDFLFPLSVDLIIISQWLLWTTLMGFYRTITQIIYRTFYWLLYYMLISTFLVVIVLFTHFFLLYFIFLYWRIKIFHYNGSLYFKKMFDKLYQVSGVLNFCWLIVSLIIFHRFYWIVCKLFAGWLETRVTQ